MRGHIDPSLFFVCSLNDPLFSEKKVSYQKTPTFELLFEHPVTSKDQVFPPPAQGASKFFIQDRAWQLINCPPPPGTGSIQISYPRTWRLINPYIVHKSTKTSLVIAHMQILKATWLVLNLSRTHIFHVGLFHFTENYVWEWIDQIILCTTTFKHS